MLSIFIFYSQKIKKIQIFIQLMNDVSAIQSLFDYYENVLNGNITDYAKKKLRLRLPICPLSLLKTIIENARVAFSKETNSESSSTLPPLQSFSNTPFSLNIVLSGNKPILDISGPIIVVGDLNGHLIDLFRLLKTFGSPKQTKYLFLGNFVNNGNFSIQVTTLLFIMKILFPTNVYILRGFQEFRDSCDDHGFWNEIYKTYGHNRQIYMSFMKAFSYMPLASIVDHSIFCVSGGIGCNVTNLDLINSIHIPTNNFNDGKIADLLLSDPTESLPLFLPNVRGEGTLFGSVAVKNFLEKISAKVIVRSKQVVNDGINVLFDGTCVSIISSSTNSGNKIAVLKVNNGEYSPSVFDNLLDVTPDCVHFIETEDENEFRSFICSRGFEASKLARLNVSASREFKQPLSPSPIMQKQQSKISTSLSFNGLSLIKDSSKSERKESLNLMMKSSMKKSRNNSPILKMKSQNCRKTDINSPLTFSDC